MSPHYAGLDDPDALEQVGVGWHGNGVAWVGAATAYRRDRVTPLGMGSHAGSWGIVAQSRLPLRLPWLLHWSLMMLLCTAAPAALTLHSRCAPACAAQAFRTNHPGLLEALAATAAGLTPLTAAPLLARLEAELPPTLTDIAPSGDCIIVAVAPGLAPLLGELLCLGRVYVYVCWSMLGGWMACQECCVSHWGSLEHCAAAG